jgi:hypothetical protein
MTWIHHAVAIWILFNLGVLALLLCRVPPTEGGD